MLHLFCKGCIELNLKMGFNKKPDFILQKLVASKLLFKKKYIEINGLDKKLTDVKVPYLCVHDYI